MKSEISDPDGSLQTLEKVERAYILSVLQKTNGAIEGAKGAAGILGLRPSTLRSRLQKLGIKIPRSSG